MRDYILEGRNFSTMDEFYNEIQKIMTSGLSWNIGHNLSAFNDVLRGGFGKHELGEDILIIWHNYELSKKMLGTQNVLNIIEIILDCRDSGHHCILELM